MARSSATYKKRPCEGQGADGYGNPTGLLLAKPNAGILYATVAKGPKLPYESLRAAAGEPFIVPSQGKNVAGGKELLRAMLSKAAATNFSKTRLAPTIVKGLVPANGFGSTALVSQTKMLDAAGSNTFNYQFVDYYGMNTYQLVPWNSFLSGQLDVAGRHGSFFLSGRRHAFVGG